MSKSQHEIPEKLADAFDDYIEAERAVVQAIVDKAGIEIDRLKAARDLARSKFDKLLKEFEE